MQVDANAALESVNETREAIGAAPWTWCIARSMVDAWADEFGLDRALLFKRLRQLEAEFANNWTDRIDNLKARRFSDIRNEASRRADSIQKKIEDIAQQLEDDAAALTHLSFDGEARTIDGFLKSAREALDSVRDYAVTIPEMAELEIRDIQWLSGHPAADPKKAGQLSKRHSIPLIETLSDFLWVAKELFGEPFDGSIGKKLNGDFADGFEQDENNNYVMEFKHPSGRLMFYFFDAVYPVWYGDRSRSGEHTERGVTVSVLHKALRSSHAPRPRKSEENGS